MDSMLWVAPLLRAFESRIQRRLSLNRLSTIMGYAKAFLARVLAHARGPRVGDLFEAQLKAGDEHPPDLYHQAYEKAANDPLRILASNRRRQGLPPSPFLTVLAPRVLALIETGATPGQNWRTRIEVIKGYERLIEVDKQECRQKLEAAIRLGIRFLERRDSRPAAALGDLGLAFASLSVILRLEGSLDDALDALLLAYPLVRTAANPALEGLWYQRSAYLLVRLDRCDRAAEFVKDATLCFVAAAAERDQARSLIDLGHVLSRAGQGEEACEQTIRGLRLLEKDDRIYLCSAHQILAEERTRQGKLSEAAEELNQASALAAGSEILLASIHWSRAKLYMRLGARTSAAEAFEAALELLQTHGSAAKVVSLTYEYSQFLLECKDWPELEKLAAGVLRYMSGRAADPELHEAIENLAALLELKTLDLRALEELRQKLPESQNHSADQAGMKIQPKGSIRDPISGASPGVAALLFGGSAPRGDSTV